MAARTSPELQDETITRFLSGWWQLNHSMKRGIEPLLEQNGLDLRRYLLLMAIFRGTVYPKELSDQLHIPATLLSRYIDGLVQGGFLERQIDQQDSRRTRLNLTETGRQVLERARTDIRTNTSARLQNIGPKKLDVLLGALETLGEFTVLENK